MTRRDFLKCLTASVTVFSTTPTSALAEQSWTSYRALWLSRGDESIQMDIGTRDGYQTACRLLRDIGAAANIAQEAKDNWQRQVTINDHDVIGVVSPVVLRHLAWMQVCIGTYYRVNPFIVHSGLRVPATNRRVGGVQASRHLPDANGMFHASDVEMHGVTAVQLGKLAAIAKQGGVGFYPKKDFIHVDDGAIRYWYG